jgi:hypothetical protein
MIDRDVCVQGPQGKDFAPSTSRLLMGASGLRTFDSERGTCHESDRIEISKKIKTAWGPRVEEDASMLNGFPMQVPRLGQVMKQHFPWRITGELQGLCYGKNVMASKFGFVI